MKPENSAASIDASMLDASPGWSAARPAATERESFCVVSPDQFKATRVFSTLDKARLLGEARARQSRVGSTPGYGYDGARRRPRDRGEDAALSRSAFAVSSARRRRGRNVSYQKRLRTIYEVRSRIRASSFISTGRAGVQSVHRLTPTLRENIHARARETL